MNRSRKRRKRLGLPPYGNNVMGVDVPNKMQRRLDGIRRDGSSDDGDHFEHGGKKWREPRGANWVSGDRRRGIRGKRYRQLVRMGILKKRPHLGWLIPDDNLPFGEF